MQIYLPIAEMPIDLLTILALGSVAGFLSGMFGIGGGFLMTPFLIFLGVPPAVAVASSANQIIASSFSGFAAHKRRGNVDFKMAGYLLAGGAVGSTFGIWLFSALKKLGQIDLVISLSYVVFLGGIGLMMASESVRAFTRRKKGLPPPQKKTYEWQARLPFKTDFPRSKLNISAVLPVAVGVVSGIIVAIMGIGGGFLMIPAMIYILGMPTSVVVGTSLLQMILITSNVTFFHAYFTHTVDVVLALMLLSGSVVGVQMGTRMGHRLPADALRVMLAFLVLAVAFKMTADLFVAPKNLYSVEFVRE